MSGRKVNKILNYLESEIGPLDDADNVLCAIKVMDRLFDNFGHWEGYPVIMQRLQSKFKGIIRLKVPEEEKG